MKLYKRQVREIIKELGVQANANTVEGPWVDEDEYDREAYRFNLLKKYGETFYPDVEFDANDPHFAWTSFDFKERFVEVK